MAVRYGIPVSEFLERHTSEELTELMAFFALQQEKPTKQPKQAADPEEHAKLLKQALFKGGK